MNFEDFSSKFSFLKGKQVFVGFSGGSDSTFLMLLLKHFQQKFHYDLTAINFEHGIRGEESVNDSKFCINFCNDNKIKIISESLKISRNTKNLECVAREKRLDYYKNNLPEDSILVLGHHADDVIENLFIRMLRGSNLSGLDGIREFTKYNGCCYTVYRPLLNYRKIDIKNFLTSIGQEWRTDSTNLESDCLRNFIRNEILEKLYNRYENSYKGILQCVKNISEDSEFIEYHVDAIFRKLDDKKSISIFELRSIDKAVRSRLIKKILEQIYPSISITKGFYGEFDKLLFSDNKEPRKLENSKVTIYFANKRVDFKFSIGIAKSVLTKKK